MVLAGHAHHPDGKQRLHADLVPKRAGGADEQVHAAAAQRIVVQVVLFRHEAQRGARHGLLHRVQQAARMDANEDVVGAHVEARVQQFQVHLLPGASRPAAPWSAPLICWCSSSARGVGTSWRPDCTKMGSPVVSRIRASVLLMAGALRCMRRAAATTLPSSSSASSAYNRFRSGRIVRARFQVHGYPDSGDYGTPAACAQAAWAATLRTTRRHPDRPARHPASP